MGRNIIIFGGSGFIGSNLTQKLLSDDRNKITVICTKTHKAEKNLGTSKNLKIKSFDIFDEKRLSQSLQNQDIVINLIGKLFELQKGDFIKFHTKFVELLTNNISKEQRLIHISALGVETSSKSSKYAKTKFDGENLVINNSQNYNIIKPSVVFGEKDDFFNMFASISKLSPFLPLIGGGKTLFAPVHVENLTDAIVKLTQEDQKYKNKTYLAFGPDKSSFKELMQFILKSCNRLRMLLFLPFFAAKMQAKLMNFLGIYTLTADQVEILKYNNIGNNSQPNIDTLVGELDSYKDIVSDYLK